MIQKIQKISSIDQPYNNIKYDKNQGVNMKKFITVINQDMINNLLDMGFKGVPQKINNQNYYSFEITDRLYKFLKNENFKFSKKDYFEDTKLRF